jgi:zinc transport system permease protein
VDFVAAVGAYGFLQHALLAGLLASLGCGVIGPYVVVKRIGFLAGGIAHSVLGGVGAALYYGADPLLGALAAAILAALLIGWVKRNWRTQEDTLIGALWAIGMAAGVLFMARTPGYGTDLMSYLFGNILLVPERELWFMAALDLVLLLIAWLFHRQFLAVAFDEEFAELRGVPVTAFYLLLLCLVAVTVVLLIQVVGLILVIALLTLPAAIASHYVHTLGRMMVLATLAGAAFAVGGLTLAFQYDLPGGATIVLLTGAGYVVASLAAGRLARWRARRSTAVAAGRPR